MASGYYVNGTNINTLFQGGTVTASTNGGFRIGGQDIGYSAKGSEAITLQQTFFRKLNLDLNTYFRNINYVPDPVITSSGITISQTGSTNQFPSISGYKSIYITAGNGTLSFDSNVTIVNIFVVGGGGGGNSSGSAAGKIGNGGGVSNNNINQTVTANTTFTVVIGTGGSPGVAGNNSSVALLSNTYTGSGGATGQTTLFYGPTYSYNGLVYGGSGGGGYGGGGGSGGNGANLYGDGRDSTPGGVGGGISISRGLVGGNEGRSSVYGGGGGGGGLSFTTSSSAGGPGGAGYGTGYGGGGAGGIGTYTSTYTPFKYTGGGGGGGNGGQNTGGGGGSAGQTTRNSYATGGSGGSGIVIIVYTY